MKFKKGFTLAEVMITLTTIGIITAVILPVAFHSKPNEDVMKFKKAHNTLFQVISTLISSEKYYQDGLFYKTADGQYAKKSTFCSSMADVLSTKKVNCDYATEDGRAFWHVCAFSGSSGVCKEENVDFAAKFDEGCKDSETYYTGDLMGVMTNDGVIYFEENLENYFGCVYGSTCGYTNAGWTADSGKSLYAEEKDLVTFESGIKTYRTYRTFCIDIDGINKGEDPFGYGLRVDGKIIVGARAQNWLEKSIQE